MCTETISENRGAHSCGCECGCGGAEREGFANVWLWPAVSLIMLITGMVMEYSGKPEFFQNTWIELGWYLLAFAPVALDVMKEAAESLAARDYFNEFTLMTVASIGAFCIGEYPEGVAVMLFYCIGEILQDKAVDRVKDNINSLLSLKVQKVVRIESGVREEVAPEEVAPGSKIYVKPGERVALDGVLLGADATFDTSALTGESMPRLIKSGEEVLAGMIPLTSPVALKVTRPYCDSALSRIIRLVEEAQDKKAQPVKFITRFARVYTPVVFMLAIALVGIPAIVAAFNPSFTYVFSEWLYRGLVFLVISCPCALVISVPLGYFVGIGAASREGILVKGGNYLDIIRKVDTFAFDKTGTLTTGTLTVREVVSAELPETDLLRYLVSAESASSHPLGLTLLKYASEKGMEPVEAKDVREISGYGITAVVDGKKVGAGNLKLMEEEGIECPAELADMRSTVVIVGIDGRYAGYVTFADEIKPEAPEMVRQLRNSGVKTLVILSGDNQGKVDETARAVGIDNAKGNLLPQDKAAYVEKAATENSNGIAYVGDGINDAPVLALSSVGIAMGGLGADIAVENSDVIIQTDRLGKIATLMKIARKTHSIIVENIVMALTIKVVILVFGAMGYVSLWAAVFADVGVSLLAILNAVRGLKVKK